MPIISLSGQHTITQSGTIHAEVVGQKATLGEDKVRSVTEMVNRDYRAGKFDLFNPSICLNHDSADTEVADLASGGKTVIQNKPTGWIITTINPDIVTADDARKSARAGGATHAFLYQRFDFLTDAAKEYASLGENEIFQHRNINDLSFVRDTLSFFTGEDYYKTGYVDETQSALMNQVTQVVQELAQQIRDGGSPDLSKVKTTLTIGGSNVSIAELMEIQKVGQCLSESFQGVSAGSLNGRNTEGFAKMGLAKSLGRYYGSSKGTIGKMFSSAIDRLYESGIAQIQKGQTWSQTVIGAANTQCNQNAIKTELDIADIFSRLDSSDDSSFSSSFLSTLSQMREMVQQYCNRNGLLPSNVGLASVTDNVSKFFQAWISKL